MTVKELAKFCGNTERSIQYWVKKACNDTKSIELAKNLTNTVSSAGHGKPADFSLDEIELILNNSTLPPLVVKVLMQNARENNNAQPSVKSSDERILTILETLTNQNQVLASMIQNQDKRISNLENGFYSLNSQIEQRKALLPPAQIEPKKHIEDLVNTYARKNNQPYANVRANLYRQFDLRYHHHSSQSAKKAGAKTTIAWIESIGQIEELEAVAIELFS